MKRNLFQKAFRVLNGHFGKKVLNQPYKSIWMIISWTCSVCLFCKCLLFPIVVWWSGVVDYLDYVIWGK